MYNPNVLIYVLQVNALETLIEIFNHKSEGQASSGTYSFVKQCDGGQWIATFGVKLVKVFII